MYIRYLDSPEHLWEKFLIEICDLDFDKYWRNREILTREILEGHLENILCKLRSIEDSISDKENNCLNIDTWDDLVVGFQIFGILILQTGSYLPVHVRDIILRSITWEFDKRRGWSKYLEKDRIFHLNDFRNKIMNHKVGRKIMSFVKYYQ